MLNRPYRQKSRPVGIRLGVIHGTELFSWLAETPVNHAVIAALDAGMVIVARDDEKGLPHVKHIRWRIARRNADTSDLPAFVNGIGKD